MGSWFFGPRSKTVGGSQKSYRAGHSVAESNHEYSAWSVAESVCSFASLGE